MYQIFLYTSLTLTIIYLVAVIFLGIVGGLFTDIYNQLYFIIRNKWTKITNRKVDSTIEFRDKISNALIDQFYTSVLMLFLFPIFMPIAILIKKLPMLKWLDKRIENYIKKTNNNTNKMWRN